MNVVIFPLGKGEGEGEGIPHFGDASLQVSTKLGILLVHRNIEKRVMLHDFFGIFCDSLGGKLVHSLVKSEYVLGKKLEEDETESPHIAFA
jgi:hypothetical protein